MADTSKHSKLAAAAEALIEAASLESDAITQKQLANHLESLKLSFDSNLNKVVQKMQSSNENFDAKINTLQQHVNLVKCEIGALKVIMEEECKQKTLERALTLTDLDSFDYYESNESNFHNSKKNSSELAKSTIKWFMVGYGSNLPNLVTLTNEYNLNSNYKSATEKEVLIKAFVDRFAKQIKVLIKREPRVVKNDNNGTYAIFYQ
jgi:hypothetical protein